MNKIIEAICNAITDTSFWIGIITAIIFWSGKTLWNKYQESKKPNSHDEELWEYIESILPGSTINLWRNSDADRRFHRSDFSPICDFVNEFSINEPSKHFLDKKLEKLKKDLVAPATVFTDIIVKYTLPNKNNVCWLPRSYEEYAPENIADIVKDAQESLDKMVNSYDNLKNEIIRKIKNKKID